MSKEVKDWLTEAYDYERPHRGEIRAGILLELDQHGAVVDVGLKHDGIVPHQDIEALDEEVLSDLELGQEVTAQIVQPKDQDGSLILSLAYVQEEKDWQEAQAWLERGEIWQGEVQGHNRGGLLVNFGQLQGFIPASHLSRRGRQSHSSERHQDQLKQYVGQELPLKFIEVNRTTNRLVASERLARQQIRQQNLDKLLNELVEGQVCRGTVRHLTRYGAFVDLGGADGLIHISELSWQRVRHPSEVLQVGDETDVYILSLDHKRKRIGLSLKRLYPNPWSAVDTTYHINQLVSGTVTNVVDFGAFVALESGIEGLVHTSELADPPPERPQDVVQPGDELVLRILRIDSFRHRIGLSLKSVSPQERTEWMAQRADTQTAATTNNESNGSRQVASERSPEQSQSNRRSEPNDEAYEHDLAKNNEDIEKLRLSV